MAELKVKMTSEQEEQLLKFADRDGDGEINFNEVSLAHMLPFQTRRPLHRWRYVPGLSTVVRIFLKLSRPVLPTQPLRFP